MYKKHPLHSSSSFKNIPTYSYLYGKKKKHNLQDCSYNADATMYAWNWR